MDFDKRMKTVIYISVIHIIMGIIFIAVNICLDYELLAGMGAGFISVSIVSIRNNMKLLKSEEERYKAEVIAKDERNLMIRKTARYWATPIIYVICYFAFLVLAFLKMTNYAVTVACFMVVMLIVEWICEAIANKKYS